jgi:hypothetical protein
MWEAKLHQGFFVVISGNPVSGIAIRVADHPEVGQSSQYKGISWYQSTVRCLLRVHPGV